MICSSPSKVGQNTELPNCNLDVTKLGWQTSKSIGESNIWGLIWGRERMPCDMFLSFYGRLKHWATQLQPRCLQIGLINIKITQRKQDIRGWFHKYKRWLTKRKMYDISQLINKGVHWLGWRGLFHVLL